jgi:hypothetical protein
MSRRKGIWLFLCIVVLGVVLRIWATHGRSRIPAVSVGAQPGIPLKSVLQPGRAIWTSLREMGRAGAARAPERRSATAPGSERPKPNIKNERELDLYLEDIVTRAKIEPRVAGLEVESGIEAILSLQEQLGADRTLEKEQAFTNRLSEIPTHRAVAEAGDYPALDAIVEGLERAQTEAEREPLINHFLQELGQLPPEDQVAQVARLQDLGIGGMKHDAKPPVH